MENKYLLSKEKDKQFKSHLKLNDYYLSHNYKSSNIKYLRDNSSFIVVIGDFIDGKNPYKTIYEITKKLLISNDIHELISKTNFFSGRYLIFWGDFEGVKNVLTDPIVSIPVNYDFNNEYFLISSHAKYIADKLGYSQSKDSKKIRKGSDQQQPLPYNITMYDEIKILIPNHFLDVKMEKAKRFFPVQPLSQKSFDYAVNQTIELTKDIIKGYFNTRKISLPITAGSDSRTILSLMKDNVSDIKMYTFYHDKFTEETEDIKIPTEISKKFNIDYEKLPVKSIPKKLYDTISDELGELKVKYVLNNAYTYYNSDLAEYESVPGDIIPLPKSDFGKALPESLATLNYFITKTHNYAPEIKKHVSKWIDETKKYSKENQVSLYDLYYFEYRLGRWLPNGIQNYDYFTNRVYIFNCRYLIELWMSIPKKDRAKRSFNTEIINKLWPELLEFPFNPDQKIFDKLFSNSYAFYAGSFLKYQLKRFL